MLKVIKRNQVEDRSNVEPVVAKPKDITYSQTRICTHCNKEKDLSEFPIMRKHNIRKDGSKSLSKYPSGKCRDCRNKYAIEHNAKRKDQINERRRFRLNNDVEFKDRIKKLKKESYYKNIENVLLRNARLRAAKSNLPFNITIEDIIIPKICPLIGIPILTDGSTSNKVYVSSPSLDKIIPELGYVKGNIRVISMKANMMKNSGSVKELLMFADNIKEYLKE